MSLKNIKKNLTPKARIVILSLTAVTGVSGYVMYQAFSSNVVNLPPSISSKVELNNDNKTEKERGDKPKVLDENTVMQKEIERLQDIDKTEAKKKGSFIDQLELNNDDKVLSEIQKDLNEREITTGIDDVNGKLKKRNDTAQDLLEKRRRLANNDSVNGQGQKSQTIAYVGTPFDENSFINEENGRLKTKIKAVSTYVGTISFSQSGSIGANYSSDKDTDSNIDKASGAGGYQYSGKPTDYSNFIRSPDEYPKADMSILDGYRKLARKEAGLSVDEPSQANYASVVYPTSAPDMSVQTKILAGDMYYSVLEIEVNTDEISPVRATIVQEGPLKGGVLLGYPSKTGDKAMIKFDTLSVNGETYSGINVVAVDPFTMRTALADEVDYHTFERYFKLAAASIVAGYAETLKEVEEEDTASGSSVETITGPDKFNERVAVAIGRVGEKLEPKFEKAFDRESTVTIYKNRDLGIMFLSDLIIKD